MYCNCKTPVEHAEHLRREVAIYNRLFREPVKFYIVENNIEKEVSRQEFVDSFNSKENDLEKDV